MKKVLFILLIIICSVSDIFLYRIGLLPAEPSFTVLPLFFISVLILYRREITLPFYSFNSWFFLIMILLNIFYVIESSYNKPFYAIANALISFMVYFCTYLYFINDEKNKIKSIFSISIAILVVSIIYDILLGNSGGDRGAGFAENPNSAALRLVMLNIVILYFLERKKNALIFSALIFFVVFLTLSRSGIILYLFSFFIIFLNKFSGVYYFRDLPFKIFRALPLILIAGFVLINLTVFVTEYFDIFQSRANLQRIAQITGQEELIDDMDTNEKGRIAIASDYFNLFIENPLGYGTGMSMNREFYYKATHNMYLRIAIDFGIVGLLFYLYFLLRGLFISIKRNNFFGFSLYLVVFIASFFTNTLIENRTFLLTLCLIDLQILENKSYYQLSRT